MRSIHNHTRAATGLALALALGTAGTATAKPVGPDSPPWTAPSQSQQVVAVPQHAAGSGSEWAYVAIAGGATGLVLIGVGGTVAAGQRRHRKERKARPTIAA
jgi:hypothetical protein